MTRGRLFRGERCGPWLSLLDYRRRGTPPLDHGTPQTDLVATGLSAEVRARLALTWSESRPSAGPAARS